MPERRAPKNAAACGREPLPTTPTGAGTGSAPRVRSRSFSSSRASRALGAAASDRVEVVAGSDLSDLLGTESLTLRRRGAKVAHIALPAARRIEVQEPDRGG